jgi:hypothetical protein
MKKNQLINSIWIPKGLTGVAYIVKIAEISG